MEYSSLIVSISIVFYLTVYSNGQSPVVKFTVETDKVQKWWPNGYGEQKLYNMQVSFQSTFPEHFTSIQRKVAFR